MKNTEEKGNEKLSESVAARITPSTKERLAEKAESADMSIGAYVASLIAKDLAAPNESQITKVDFETKRFRILFETEVKENSKFREELKKVFFLQQPKVEINNNFGKEKEEKTKGKTLEKVESKKTTTPSLLDLIMEIVPDDKKEQFLKEFKKMSTNRIKMKLDKNEDETIYHCIKYCLEWGAFFAS